MSNAGPLQGPLCLGCAWAVNCMSSIKAGRREDSSVKPEGTPESFIFVLRRLLKIIDGEEGTLKDIKCLECLEFDKLGKVNTIIHSGLKTPSSRYLMTETPILMTWKNDS